MSYSIQLGRGLKKLQSTNNTTLNSTTLYVFFGIMPNEYNENIAQMLYAEFMD